MVNNFNEIFLKYKMGISFIVFSSYFQDEDDFKIFVNALSKEKREKFLRLSEFYNDFIHSPTFMDENIENYFSLIMIFSLIEATMSEENYLTFDEYLSKNFIPIPDKETLKRIKEEYFNKFGSQRQVKKFFDDHVDKECKEIFACACVSSKNEKNKPSDDEKIKQNIKLFYQWRSSFVHSAEIPIAFRESGFYYMKNKNIITTAYERKDFEQLFEHGFLRYFGYTKKFEHENVEEKIKQYKNHTVTKASAKISQSIKFLSENYKKNMLKIKIKEE